MRNRESSPAPQGVLEEKTPLRFGKSLRAGGQCNRSHLVVFLNKCDQVDDPELIDLVEVRVTRLMSAEIEGSWQPVGATIEGIVLVTDDPIGYYNLAGVLALLGRHDESLAALERDLELGDADWQYLEADAWFESLRDDPRFRDLLKRMKAAAGEDA